MPQEIENPQQNRKNRKIILGIFGIPAAVLVLSSVLYLLVNTKTVVLGTVNNGELILPPLPLVDLPLTTPNGETFDYSKPEPKWAFIVFGDDDCQDSCAKMLYIARQSITALAKNMNRVRLIYVTTNGVINADLQQRLDREYIGIDVLAINRDTIEMLFSETEIKPFAPNSFNVADPRGWLMMQYAVENTDQETLNVLGKAVVKDMKRLIK